MFYVGTGKNAKEFRFDDTQVRLWEVTIHGQRRVYCGTEQAVLDEVAGRYSGKDWHVGQAGTFSVRVNRDLWIKAIVLVWDDHDENGQALILDHSMMAGQIVDVFQSYDGDGYIQVSDHDALRFEQR
jgi:hypothetical protein